MVLAVHGKALRGTRDAGVDGTELIRLYDQASGLVRPRIPTPSTRHDHPLPRGRPASTTLPTHGVGLR